MPPLKTKPGKEPACHIGAAAETDAVSAKTFENNIGSLQQDAPLQSLTEVTVTSPMTPV